MIIRVWNEAANNDTVFIYFPRASYCGSRDVALALVLFVDHVDITIRVLERFFLCLSRVVD